MRVLGVIPARYASSRFPGKPLVPIAGVPMVVRVWQQARQCTGISQLVIATDDYRIFHVAADAGAEVWMTHPDHPSGTDRMLEVADRYPGYDAYLNIQGDEPLLNPQHLQALIDLLAGQPHPQAIGTLVCPIAHAEELHRPSAVKAVMGQHQRVLYFSRAAVPHLRDEPNPQLWPSRYPYHRHLGLYGFKAMALEQLRTLPPHPLELAEGLEQLRWLAAGLPIYAQVVEGETPAVDTPEDLARVEAWLARWGQQGL